MVPFAVLRTLPDDEVRAFVALLEAEVAPRLAVQAKGYARGRACAWLAWQPSFGDPPVAHERPRGELWRRLLALVPEAEAAECWRNGEGSSPGIHPHRDSPYADRQAWVLNLGPTTFRIWLPREADAAEPLRHRKTHTQYAEYEAELRGGELLSFDCKRMHGSRTAAPERWGIGLWRFKPAWRQRATFR